MAKQAPIEQEGTIIESLSNAMFRVELENGRAARSTNAILTASTAPSFSTSAGSIAVSYTHLTLPTNRCV